jgi:hypothetical protein
MNLGPYWRINQALDRRESEDRNDYKTSNEHASRYSELRASSGYASIGARKH